MIGAVICPLTDPFAPDATARLSQIQATYGPMLGGGPVYARAMPDGYFFLSADPADAIDRPPSDDAPGSSRYDWVDQGGGVSFGTLKSGGP